MGTFRYRLNGSTIRPTPILDMIHIAYVPDFGVYFKAEVGRKFKYYTVGLQMVLGHGTPQSSMVPTPAQSRRGKQGLPGAKCAA